MQLLDCVQARRPKRACMRACAHFYPLLFLPRHATACWCSWRDVAGIIHGAHRASQQQAVGEAHRATGRRYEVVPPLGRGPRGCRRHACRSDHCVISHQGREIASSWPPLLSTLRCGVCGCYSMLPTTGQPHGQVQVGRSCRFGYGSASIIPADNLFAVRWTSH